MDTEFPKMLYRDGAPYSQDGRGVPHQDTRLVHSHAEEEEANAEGFLVATLPDPEPEDAVAPAEEVLPPLTEDQQAVFDGAEGDAAEATADANGDGHDDADGEFVSPNPGRRGKKKP